MIFVDITGFVQKSAKKFGRIKKKQYLCRRNESSVTEYEPI